jgi:hypothetical protein
METGIEMVEMGARGVEARATEMPEGLIETGIDRIAGAPFGEQGSIQTGLERIIAENKALTPAEAASLENIDLGGLRYEAATTSQQELIGDIADWVARIRRVYGITGRKTRINIADFKRDAQGLNLMVIENGEPRPKLLTYKRESRSMGYYTLKGLARINTATRAKLQSLFPGVDLDANLSPKKYAQLRITGKDPNIGVVPLDISNQDLRITATRAEAAVCEVVSTTRADANTETSISGEDVERLQELERGVKSGKADLIARIQELEKVGRSITETAESLTADQSKLERLEPTESEFVETQDRIERHEERLRSLREQRDAHIAAIASIRGNLRSQITRIRDTIDKVLNIDRGLGEQLRTIFTEQGVTIVSLVAAVSAILAAIITALTRAAGSAAQAVTGGGANPGKPPGPDAPSEPSESAGARQYVKNALEKFSQLMKKLATKVLAALPGIIGSIVSWLLSLLGRAASWFAQNLWLFAAALIAIVLAELRSRRVF